MYIVSIAVDNRVETIPDVQGVFTKYGKNIITRLGIHNPDKPYEGIMIISYVGENIEEFVEALNMLNDTKVNFMEV